MARHQLLKPPQTAVAKAQFFQGQHRFQQVEVVGEPVRLNPAELIFRDARLMGSSGTSRAAVRQAAGLVAQGLVRPVVQEVLPLEQAADAFEMMSERKILGRVVLTVP